MEQRQEIVHELGEYQHRKWKWDSDESISVKCKPISFFENKVMP